MLELVDLSRKLSKDEYRERLPGLRRRLLELQQACWKARIPSLLVFEGWDASGKGPTIRRLTERLEPRGFEVHYLTDRPRTYELDLPWMWRFWLTVPRYGAMAIYDRSWYRRGLVERLDGGADDLRWHRILRDVADFERTLADDGYVVVKFFFHISGPEQTKRYKKWRKDPSLSWMVDEKEWIAPDRYDECFPLIEEMLQATEAEWGPWVLVPATDKCWRRVTVFETLIRRLEEALAVRGLPLPGDGGEEP